MTEDLRPPFRQQFDNARDPYTARNALGITGTGGGGGGGAPTDAEYIVAVDDPDLTNDRVLTNTATVTWDFTTPGQAKANAAAGAGPFQPLDPDLTSLAAASATNTIYYRSAANTWGPVTIGSGLTFTGGTLTGSGGVTYTASTTAPVAPNAGDFWYDLTTGVLSIYVNDGTSSQWVQVSPVPAAAGTGALGSGRLEYVSATALKFAPYGGNQIKINGALFTIPTAGIAGLTNGGLSANTTYYVYAFLSGSTVTAEFSATGHVTSTAASNEGVEIKSGDNTRTLIGMCRTDASSQFVDNAANRFVISWFNRRNLAVSGANSNGASTTSSGLTEVAVVSRVSFLLWEDHCILSLSGYMNSNTAGAPVQASIFISGVEVLDANSRAYFYPPSTNVRGSAACGAAFAASEGNCLAQLGGMSGGGTANFWVSIYGMIRG